MSVTWEGCWDLWPIRAMEEGSGERLVASQSVLRVFQRQTFSLLALIDDQVDGCWSWTLLL